MSTNQCYITLYDEIKRYRSNPSLESWDFIMDAMGTWYKENKLTSAQVTELVMMVCAASEKTDG